MRNVRALRDFYQPCYSYKWKGICKMRRVKYDPNQPSDPDPKWVMPVCVILFIVAVILVIKDIPWS